MPLGAQKECVAGMILKPHWLDFLSRPAIAVALLVACMAQAETTRLSPDRVVELAQTQSVVVEVSEFATKGEEYALKGAWASFFPTLSVSAGMTHLSEQATIEGLGGDGGGLAQYLSMDTTRTLHDMLQDTILAGFFAGMSEPMTLGPQNIYNLGITVSQPLFTGGKLMNGYRIARLRHEAQVFTHERTVSEAGLTALRLLWYYVLGAKAMETVVETRQWFENLVGDQQKMFQSGMITELDLLNTKTELATRKLEELKASHRQQTLREQLLLFLRLPLSDEVEVDTSGWNREEAAFTPPVPDSVENWLLFRGDLQAARRQIDMLESFRRIHRGSYAPTVAAFYTYSYGNQYSTTEGELEENQSVGLSLNWTIFDWGKGLREMQKARCQMEAAKLQVTALRDQVRLKILEFARSVEEARLALHIAEEAVRNAQRSLEIAELQYEAQMITNTELLQVRMTLTGTKMKQVQARIDAALALAEYRVASVSSAGVGSVSGSGSSSTSGQGM